jgi:cytosine/adenosine deaminase-related metal-dependent hydrolase
MPSPPPTLLTAAWIAPMDRPPIREGGVVISNGRIIAVGETKSLRHNHPGAAVEEYPSAILLPGLVNAHVHLELSDLRQGPRPASFVQWLMDLMGQTARLGGAMADTVAHAIRTGVAQCLRFGVCTVGDISKQCMFSRPVLAKTPLRAVSFGELQAMAQRRGLLDERFAAATDLTFDSDRLIVGVTPHAPYTVEAEGYRRCLEFARSHHRPLATHLAENPLEAEFLADQTGPFRHLWEVGVNAWDENVPRYQGGPIRLARDLGLLDFPTLLAHVNYCDDAELDILAAGRASVVYCPRTHAYFGHPPHRWRQMLERGINVAVGTDSCASSPDLNLVDDLRLLRQIAPQVPALDLWQMATLRAAAALQLETQIGSLTPGKRADLVAFEIGASIDPLEEILQTEVPPTRLWIDGEIHQQFSH